MRRSLSAVFGLVVLLAVAAAGLLSGLADARSGKADRGKAAAKRAAAASAERGRELVGLRTSTSKTFLKASGVHVVKVFPTPIHFKDARGGFREIDSSLKRQGSRYVNRAGRYGVALPADIGKGPVRVRKGTRWLEFSLRGARGAIQPKGAEGLYRNALPGVDVSYKAQASSVKETMILSGPSAQRSYVFDLKLSAGLRPRVLENRGLVVKDRRNRTRMAFAAPWMRDAAGKESSRVSFSVQNVAGTWRLTMTPSSRWLDAKGRKWPVLVDPYVYTEADEDCSLNQDTPTTSFCGTDTLAVGTSTHNGTTTPHAHNAVLRFPGVSQIPKDADIHYALLSLRAKGTGGDQPSWVRSEVKPLKEPFTGQATWNSNDGVDRWSEPGGEVEETWEEGSKAWIGPDMTSWTNWVATKMVREWVTGKRANHGLKITAPTNQYVEFHSSEHPANTTPEDDGDEPQLEIEYTLRFGAKRGWQFEQMKLSDRINLQVNPASGNLMVRQTDFTMPGGLGPDIGVTRTYNSLNDRWSRLGIGWTLDTAHDVSLHYWGDATIYRGPSGVNASYEWWESENRWRPPAGFDSQLTVDGNGNGTITENQSQSKQHFDSAGKLLDIEDRNGRRIKFGYATSGPTRATTIKNEADETKVTFAYDGTDRLDGFTDAASRVYDYQYNADNKLVAYADPQNGQTNKTLYEYSPGWPSRLSKITTPAGKIATIEYYPNDHEHAGKVKAVTRVTNTSNMSGARTEFTYDHRRDSSGETEVTDPNGSATADANDRIWRYTYDDQGRTTKYRDPLGRETQRAMSSTSKVASYTSAGNSGTTPNTKFSYDDQGPNATDNLMSTETSTGQGTAPMTTSYGYGAAGQINANTPGSQWLPTESTNEDKGVTRTNYQVPGQTNGNVSGIAQFEPGANGAQVSNVSFDYEPNATAVNGKPGQLKAVRDGRNNPTTYGYDAKGNLTTITPPAPLAPRTMEYTQTINRLAKMRDGKGNWRIQTYDNLDRLKKTEFTGADQTLAAGEAYVEYTYDRDGNQLTEVTRREGQTALQTRSITYDALNRVINELNPGGGTTTYTYDWVGNLKSLTDSAGKVEYTYDAANQQRAIYEPGSSTPIKFEHNLDGLRTKTILPGGVQIQRQYDDAQRLTRIAGGGPNNSTIVDLTYKYGESTLRSEKYDGRTNQRTKYTYDGLQRLVNATIKSGPDIQSEPGWTNGVLNAAYTFGLDPAGNVTQRTVTGTAVPQSTTNYAYNAANQLCWRSPTSGAALPATPCAAGTQQTAFDANGNQTTGPSLTMAFNTLDQTSPINGSALTYLGEGQARWVSEGGATFQHNVLGLGLRAVGSATTAYTRDEDGGLVARRSGTTRHYYVTDALGSVVALTDTAGAVTERYEYDPYGMPAPSGTGMYAAGTINVPQGQYGFAGGYRSVGGTYHFGQRFYDPNQMRWTQPDPLDQTGDLRQGNLYGYAAGDPVNHSDPRGTCVSLFINLCDEVNDASEWAEEKVRGTVEGAYDRLPGPVKCGLNIAKDGSGYPSIPEGSLDACLGSDR